MSDTKLVAQEIEALRRRRKEIQERHENDIVCLDEDISALQKRILDGGETSGDGIMDYLLAAYGYIDHEISLPFRRIEEQFIGKTGQFFLVVVRSKVRHMFGGCFGGEEPRESDYHLETRYTLGILSAEKLVFDAKKWSCGLPTETYVELSFGTFGGQPDKKTGPFLLVDGFRGLGKVIQTGRAGLEVIVGCEEVFAYSPPEFQTEPEKRPSHWVIALNQAIRRLGRNLPEAPEEIAALERQRTETLNRLNQKRDHLRVLGEYGAQRAELEKCKDELRALLVKAKELGLKDRPLVRLVESEL